MREPRRRANVFGEVAGMYDRARPGYPDEVIDLVTGSVDSPERVIEAGAGTGKATALFAVRGLSVTAVEPDARMAEVCRENLTPWRAVNVRVERFEDAALDASSYDLGVSAQAWHWVDPTAGAATMADAIRPGGVLGLMWNRPSPDDDDIRLAIAAVYEQHAPTLTGPENLLSPQDVSANHFGPLTDHFAAPEQHDVAWVQRYTSSEFAELTRTHSPQRMLTHDRRARLTDAIEATIDDVGGGFYDYRYVTTLMCFRRE